MRKNNSIAYIPVRGSSIAAMYPWNMWIVDLFSLVIPGVGFLGLIAKRRIEKFFGIEGLFVDSGAAALVTALLAGGITEGDEVLVPSFVCTEVIDAIYSARAVPVYIEITDAFTIDLVDLSNKISSKTHALIVSNTYGILDDFKSIEGIIMGKGIVVINDLAQVVWDPVKDINPNMYGDFVIYSFGPQKFFSSIGGGFVAARSSFRIKALFGHIPKQKTLYTEVIHRFFRRIHYYVRFIFFKKSFTSHKSPTDYVSPTTIVPKRGNPRMVIAVAIKTFFYKRQVQTLSQKIERMKDALSVIGWIKNPVYRGAMLYYTIQVPEGARFELGDFLAKSGFQSVWNYTPVYFYEAYRTGIRTPRSEAISERVLSLPFRGLSCSRINTMLDRIIRVNL
jgi:dTDP-4-amino-4,6-dideoxygalactose transaminase